MGDEGTIAAPLPAPNPSYLRRWALPRGLVSAFAVYIFWGTHWYHLTALGLIWVYAYTSYQDYRGLGQWPTPSGPYYNWWMRHDSQEDYYLWLSRIHDHYRPWVWWAIDEKLSNGETTFTL